MAMTKRGVVEKAKIHRIESDEDLADFEKKAEAIRRKMAQRALDAAKKSASLN